MKSREETANSVVEECTTVELLAEIQMRASDRRTEAHGEHPDASREFALAITHAEDAQMRYTRGRAIETGAFEPGDLGA